MNKSESSISKKTRRRSSSYPAFSLEEVIENTKNLREKLGDGPYSREHMAVALGHKGVTGISAAKIAACVHFGLLDRNGSAYSQSGLASRYFNYLNDDERMQILIEAFSRPALYQKLIVEYNGKSLPQMLESIFVRNYGIQENAARGAVTNFRGSAEFVGVLKNGILSIDESDDISSERQTDIVRSETLRQNGRQMSQPVFSNATSEHLSVTLPSGLVVSYTQELAPAFAFGIFGNKLIELDKAIADYRKDLGVSGGDADSVSAEEA